jgi:hypothetical protein
MQNEIQNPGPAAQPPQPAAVSPPMMQQLNNTLNSFSTPSPQTGTTNETFLQSNGIVANFAFLILVLIVFLFLLNLGIYCLNWIMQPSSSPYIVKGMVQGNQYFTVSRNPKSAHYVSLQHSNNRKGGMEFTWSVWLNFNHIDNLMNTDYSHIFSVGTNDFDSITGLARGNNGPGLYLRNLDPSGELVTTANILLVMDIMGEKVQPGTNGLMSTETTTSTTEISNVPYNKWFHLAMRMQYNSMDIYINGIISNRINFDNVPKQNYQDILLCANGGFNGQLSNLRYYNYALNVFEITNIVYWGPNTTLAKVGNAVTSSGDYNYLSNIWYLNKY